MPFGLCNAPGTFQRCMMAIFSDMVKRTIEVFMDDFSVLGRSFDNFLKNLRQALIRCEETNLVTELGEVSLHGEGRHCIGAPDIRKRNRGR